MPPSEEKDILKRLKDLIREHPGAVLILTLISTLAIAWNIIMGYHSLVVENKNATIESKTATIETQSATLEGARGTITNLQERLNAKDEQLVNKDKQLTEYRNRALIIKAAQTSYAQLTNKELRQKTLQLVDMIRKLTEKYRQSEDKTLANIAGEWSKRMEESYRLSTELMNTYNRQYKNEAILLKDELLSRLPNNVKRNSLVGLSYEFPTNPIGINTVIDDLEILAKSLQEN